MIPKIIHYCWLGDKPLPKSAKKCIKSWKKYCPDYEIKEWNETNYDFTKNQYMKQAYEAKKWGFVPDYARLDLIFQYGGIYLDTDVELIKSFDSLLELKGFAGFESDENVNFGQGFGAEAGNEAIKILRDSYDSLSFLNEDGSPILTPSPQLNSDVLGNQLGMKRSNMRQTLAELEVFPTDYFCPKSVLDGILRVTENTYSIHHFDASWTSPGYRQAMKEHTKRNQKRENKRKRHAKIKSIIFKCGLEKLYNKIRKP